MSSLICSAVPKTRRSTSACSRGVWTARTVCAAPERTALPAPRSISTTATSFISRNSPNSCSLGPASRRRYLTSLRRSRLGLLTILWLASSLISISSTSQGSIRATLRSSKLYTSKKTNRKLTVCYSMILPICSAISMKNWRSLESSCLRNSLKRQTAWLSSGRA